MKDRRLRDTDAGERMHRLRAVLWLGPAVFVMLSLAEYKMVGVSPTLFWLMPLNVLVVALLVFGLLHGVDLGARGWVRMVQGAGNLPPAPSFSAQESLIARGHYTEAEKSFREHLGQNPGDHDARLILASLCWHHLNDPVAAERLYLEIRQGNPGPRQETAAANQLIDLYRATGQRGRLMGELARYAERYAGSRAGMEAKRVLGEMKREDPAERED